MTISARSTADTFHSITPTHVGSTSDIGDPGELVTEMMGAQKRWVGRGTGWVRCGVLNAIPNDDTDSLSFSLCGLFDLPTPLTPGGVPPQIINSRAAQNDHDYDQDTAAHDTTHRSQRLASRFSSSRNNKFSRGGALSSTSEAFSLPVSSPVTATHPDAFNTDSLAMNEPNFTGGSMIYSYPPGRNGPYGCFNGVRMVLIHVAFLRLIIFVSCLILYSSYSRQSTLLPTHNTPLSPSAPYPPLSHTWAWLRAWLGKEYPELGDTLNWGIPPEDLAQLEMQFGFALPAPVRESYLITDGQEPESSASCSEGLFFGLQLLPLEDVLDEWRFWRDVDKGPNTGVNSQLRELMQSILPGYVRREYSQRGWIPLVSDKAGNYLGVDMNPPRVAHPGK
jgi:cell wall assembly regulator SMI1